jgi:hypothetical protein
MNRAAVRLLISLATAALAVVSLPAFAAAQRTFVASSGNDANPCSLTLPCRSFGAALLQTLTDGEIIVVDSAGYGPVTINKAVSIIAPAGIYAGVTNGAGDGILVNAPGANVVLRGLEINGLGTSTGSGIVNQASASLLVDRCTVSGFANVVAALTAGESGIHIVAGPVTITDTVVRNNARGGIVVRGADAGNFIHVTIVRSRIENNGNPVGTQTDGGLAVVAGAVVTVRDSVATGNFRGFQACGGLGLETLSGVLSIDNSLSDRNVVGVFVAPNAVACAIRVSNSTITNNTLFGMEAQGGNVITSLGNNFVHNNAGGETFGATVAPK